MGANRLASSRRRVTTQAWDLSAARNAMAAKALSATTTMRRPGSQRRICRTIWRAASSSVFGARGAVGVEPLGGHEGGEDGERHEPLRPGYGSDQHGAEPAQAARLDEVAFRGADGIAIDPACLDLRSPSALDGVVEADHDLGSGRHESVDEKIEQALGHSARRPDGAGEHAVVGGVVRLVLAPEDAQRRRDGAPPGRQKRAGEQQERVDPGRPVEQVGEGRQV